MMPGVAELHFECTELLHREAELLDEGRYADWLALFLPDATYEIRPALGDGWYAQETAATLGLRIKRLGTAHAWAEEPRSRTQRFVTNVRAREDGADVLVRSNVLVYRVRDLDGPGVLLCGERHDRLRRADGVLRVASRSVRLVDRVLQMPNLAIVL